MILSYDILISVSGYTLMYECPLRCAQIRSIGQNRWTFAACPIIVLMISDEQQKDVFAENAKTNGKLCQIWFWKLFIWKKYQDIHWILSLSKKHWNIHFGPYHSALLADTKVLVTYNALDTSDGLLHVSLRYILSLGVCIVKKMVIWFASWYRAANKIYHHILQS